MLGVRRFGICLGTLVLLVAGDASAFADEFGNILVPSVENASRRASADALGAASLILKGFQGRELRDLNNEKESFASAAEGLRAAAQQMGDILQLANKNPDLAKVLETPFAIEKDVPERDRPTFAFWVSRTGTKVGDVKTRADVFRVFERDTLRLAGVVESNIGNYDRDVFRRITDDLGLYLRMGNVVSSIMRTT